MTQNTTVDGQIEPKTIYRSKSINPLTDMGGLNYGRKYTRIKGREIGVMFAPKIKKWIVRIPVRRPNGGQIGMAVSTIGSFATEIEANEAYAKYTQTL
jgi:hypothetical protein